MKRNILIWILVLVSFSGYSQAIFDAIEKQDYKKTERLLKDKENIEMKDKNGLTPLWRATTLNNEKMVTLLINYGADVNFTLDMGVSSLIYACQVGYLEIVKILVSNGADIEQSDNEYKHTSLRIATRNGHIEIVKYLVEQGADIDTKGTDLYTPLNMACWKGHIEIVKFLIENNADINSPDKDGDTPLNNCASQGHLEIVKYLISNGADKNIKNKEGKTAIDCAKKHGYPKVIEYLESI
jgi:uncharacterized protein